MNASDIPRLHAHREPASAAGAPPAPPASPDTATQTLIGNLKRIGRGAAADGHPWPERYLLPGRRLALADADCALAGLRVVHEVLLAAERARQNGAPDQDVGDRVMEGLLLACVALSAQATERVQVEGTSSPPGTGHR